MKEIRSLDEFDGETAKKQLTVCDFFAEWCGPCKTVAPFVLAMAAKYPDVNFIKVDVDKLKDLSQREQITAMPTFKFYIEGRVVFTMQGANPSELESKIQELKVNTNPFAGKAVSLGGGSSEALSKEAIAAARAARFGGNTTSVAPKPVAAQTVLSKAVLNADEDDDEALAKAIAISMSEQRVASSSSSGLATAAPATAAQKEQDAADEAEAKAEIAAQSEWDEEMVPLPVDESLLSQLLEMGFPDARSRKAIHHGTSLEGAMTWLTDHENDPEIDQPYMVRKADTVPKRELTPEEKAEKLAKMTALIKQRRIEREKAEKIEEIKREKERRERGQNMEETQEKREAMMRKRENDRIKKEKEDTRKERERLRAEIERDKEIRRLNKGLMPSVLGADGYNPSAIQYDQKGPDSDTKGAGAAGADAKSAAAPAEAKPVTRVSVPSSKSSGPVSNPVAVIDTSIETLMKYRSGGDGGNALKLLLTFVKNVVDNPIETKYRSINAESAVYKSKLSSLVGPAALLKALGFEKNDEGKLVLREGEDRALLSSTATKLAQAAATYAQMNP